MTENYITREVSKEILDLVPNHGVLREINGFIAGGVLVPPNDEYKTSFYYRNSKENIDVFFKTEEDFKETFSRFKKSSTMEHRQVSNHDNVLRSKKTLDSEYFSDKFYNYFLIKEFFGSPQEILDKFDFTVCKRALSYENNVFFITEHVDTEKDIKHNILRLKENYDYTFRDFYHVIQRINHYNSKMYSNFVSLDSLAKEISKTFPRVKTEHLLELFNNKNGNEETLKEEFSIDFAPGTKRQLKFEAVVNEVLECQIETMKYFPVSSENPVMLNWTDSKNIFIELFNETFPWFQKSRKTILGSDFHEIDFIFGDLQETETGFYKNVALKIVNQCKDSLTLKEQVTLAVLFLQNNDFLLTLNDHVKDSFFLKRLFTETVDPVPAMKMIAKFLNEVPIESSIINVQSWLNFKDYSKFIELPLSFFLSFINSSGNKVGTKTPFSRKENFNRLREEIAEQIFLLNASDTEKDF